MGKCKIKAIQTYLGTFMHNQAYTGIVQAYSGIFKTLFNRGIFTTVVYPEPETYAEPWHIHNPGIFRTPVHSERWHVQNSRHIENPVKYLE